MYVLQRFGVVWQTSSRCSKRAEKGTAGLNIPGRSGLKMSELDETDIAYYAEGGKRPPSSTAGLGRKQRSNLISLQGNRITSGRSTSLFCPAGNFLSPRKETRAKLRLIVGELPFSRRTLFALRGLLQFRSKQVKRNLFFPSFDLR